MTDLDYAAILADPPRVHPGAPNGLYNADPEMCRHLAGKLSSASTSLETGLGLSTIAFAASGARHTSFFLGDGEGETLREWMRSRGISDDHLALVSGPSQQTLPQHVPSGPLDLVLIDGNHGFPFPMLDFYFGARWLRVGGTLAIDDLGLPAPAMLYSTLADDARWSVDRATRGWASFTRLADHSFDEEWVTQDLRVERIAASLAARAVSTKAAGQPRRMLRAAYRRVSS